MDVKPKVFQNKKNIFISIISILTLLIGGYRTIYWSSYYSYFNIDMRYVSASTSWTFNQILSYSLAFSYFIVTFPFVLQVYAAIISKDKKFYSITIMRAVFILCAIYIVSVMMSMVNYSPISDEQMLKKCLIQGIQSFPFICIACVFIYFFLICIYFYRNRMIDDLYEKTSDGTKHINEWIVFRYGVSIIGTLFFVALIICGIGNSRAAQKKDFLVTEDNKYIAMPISSDRYALIEFEETEDSIILFTEKQNFHEINGFPCTRQLFNKETVRIIDN